MTFNVKYFQYWFLYMFVFTYNDLNNKSQAAILRTISLLSSLFCYSVQLSFLMVFPLWPFLWIMISVSLLPLSVSVFMMCLYAVRWGITCPLVMITMETIFHGNRMECFRSHCHCCRYLLRLVFPQKGAGENFLLVVSEYCLGSQSELLKNRTDSNKQ